MVNWSHPSLANLREEDLVEQLVSPLHADMLYNIVGFPKTPRLLTQILLKGLPGNPAGDLDLLIVAETREHESVAIQVKKIKAGAKTFHTGLANGLGNLPEGMRQTNLLARIGFHLVYLYLILVVDSREQNAGKISYAGLPVNIKSSIDQASVTSGLDPRVGLIRYEFVQPMDHAPLTVGTGGLNLERLAQATTQPDPVTKWVEEKLRS